MITKKTTWIGAILLALIVAMGTMVGTLLFVQARSAFALPSAAGDSRDFKELNQVMDIIQARSINDYTDEELMTAALKGVMDEIGDRYAYYFTKEEYEEYLQEEEGTYVGIGVSIQQLSSGGTVVVTSVFDGSAAMEVGVKPGDILTHVEGQSIEGMDTTMIASLVRGEEGTYVNLTFTRKDEPYTVAVQRRTVTTRYLSSEMLPGNIAYIRILEFSGSVDQDFKNAVNTLVKKGGAKGLIIDLRNNPGGSKDIVCKIADVLMPEGPIITLRDRDGKEQTDMSDKDYLGLPTLVLVNEYSASASELLSGSLQDTGMAKILGVQTFGKGTAQRFYETKNKGMAKLTTSQYFTAGGHCPQDVGITPDFVVEPSEALAETWVFGGEDDNQLAEAIHIMDQMMRE